MKTNKTQKAPKMKTQKQAAAPKVVETRVEVKVAKDPNQRTGLRGLKGLVFDRFAQDFAKTNDLAKLTDREEMTKIVAEKFPQSMWIAKPKIHYSYYKSKFISSVQPKA